MTAADPDHPTRRLDYLPWEYLAAGEDVPGSPVSDRGDARGTSPEERERQAERRRRLAELGKTDLADDVFVASTAAVFCDELRMGKRSYIAAHAYVTGEIRIGADSTINPFAVVRGRITIGDGVRIGAHTSLIAFNHGTTATDQPIFRQPHTSLGITVGDDVWIGSNAIVLDGITIGPHSIIGAGSVVTKNVDPWSVVAGNPARTLRDRRDPATRQPSGKLSDQAGAFAARAREQLDDVLQRCYDGERFVDRPGLHAEGAVRPWCDAIEISDLLLHRAPTGHSTADLVRRLRARQDPQTGLVAPGDLSDQGLEQPFDTTDLSVFHGPASYHILCAGYALQLLDSCFEHPITLDPDPAALEHQLDTLPWARNAWTAGAGIDALGTAIARNLNDHRDIGHGPLLTLMGWLTARVDPETGLWGKPHPDDGWLQVVNGFYRLTRGTYAQFGLPLPYPEAAVKTVLTHAQDRAVFSGTGYNACNVLDVIHPLWLAGQQTDFGRADGQRWAEAQLSKILTHWVDGQGFAFAPSLTGVVGWGQNVHSSDERAVPGLQGTEMWLAIIWLLTDYLGFSDVLAYRPRGVHRPEPLVRVPVGNYPLP